MTTVAENEEKVQYNPVQERLLTAPESAVQHVKPCHFLQSSAEVFASLQVYHGWTLTLSHPHDHSTSANASSFFRLLIKIPTAAHEPYQIQALYTNGLT